MFNPVTPNVELHLLDHVSQSYQVTFSDSLVQGIQSHFSVTHYYFSL